MSQPKSLGDGPSLLRSYLRPRKGEAAHHDLQDAAECGDLTLATRTVLHFAYVYGLDTRLGVYCFDWCATSDVVLLDLEKLRLSVMACAPNKHSRYQQEYKRLARERLLSGQQASLRLGPRDLEYLKSCASSLGGAPEDPKERLGLTRPPKVVIQTLRAQERQMTAPKVPWGRTLLLEDAQLRSLLSQLLLALGARDGPEKMELQHHVSSGLSVTSQRLRSRREYLDDSHQVGTAVEEMEVLVRTASVPRPPALLLVPEPSEHPKNCGDA
jgi:hypothetical protein